MSRDLMHSEELKDLVRAAYAAVDADTTDVAKALYDESELGWVPDEAVSRALGVNNHLSHARIKPGDTVLDVGCGGGIDSVIAGKRTGPNGRVIALDFLPEMLQRTAVAAKAAGLENVEVREGEMETIPLADNSVDYIISNGVINLSPRKARVVSECARVLAPGGGFCISDIMVEEDSLPPEVMTHPAAWAG